MLGHNIICGFLTIYAETDQQVMFFEFLDFLLIGGDVHCIGIIYIFFFTYGRVRLVLSFKKVHNKS